ncbi:MAG TPA: HAD family phosphatase [Segetibacter sp.]
MIKAIIFDLGGVLIDWNPEYLYKKIFNDEHEMKNFLQEVCTPDWNEEQDAGRTVFAGTQALIKAYPAHEENIKAFYDRWPEMLGGPIEGAVEIFKRLKESDKYKLYALTNWSNETFPIAQERYSFLNWFDGIVVSGTEKIRKPATAFYKLLLDRYTVQPSEALFIDDNKRNIDAASKLGIDSIHYKNAAELEKELEKRNILG